MPSFYLPADEFFRANIPTALTFDDVTLATLYSEILPRDADTSTSISESLSLQIPIISSDMDTVTEIADGHRHGAQRRDGPHPLQHGAEGPGEGGRPGQAPHPRPDPGSDHRGPTQAIGDVLAMIDEKRLRVLDLPRGRRGRAPVRAALRQRRQGALPGEEGGRSDDAARAAQDRGRVRRFEGPDQGGRQFFSANIGINKMLVVDRDGRLRGLVTASDVERITGETKSRRKPARDAQFRLVVGAALSPKRTPDGELDREAILSHVGNLVDEHIDAVAVSTAHGHTVGRRRGGEARAQGLSPRSR
jgi:IMP dehydrogenase